jgi:hypothetical protein
VAIRAYYDGSSDEKRANWLTLANFSGTDEAWNAFEAERGNVLSQHNAPRSIDGSPFIHMADAMKQGQEFSGWTIGQVKALVFELVKAINCHSLYGAVCTVNLVDYKRAKHHLRTHPDSPESICVEQCVNAIHIPPGCERAPGLLHLYFGQNDKFRHKIGRVWDRTKKRKDAGWPLQIAQIDTVNSREVFGIQAADVVAWIFNRHYTIGDQEDMWFWVSLLQPSELYDYDKIMKKYGVAQ